MKRVNLLREECFETQTGSYPVFLKGMGWGGRPTERIGTARIYFLSVPFPGGLFGAMIYFMLLAGLFVLAPTQTPTILNQTVTEPNPTETGPVTQNKIISSNNTVGTPNGTRSTITSTTNSTVTMTNSTTSNGTRSSTAPHQGNVSTLAINPLAALAGYNWEWAVIIFNRIGDSFKEIKEETPSTKSIKEIRLAQLRSFTSSAIFGNDKMFKPRWKPEYANSDPDYFSPQKWTYVYDHSPLEKTLEKKLDKYIDYVKLNPNGKPL